MDHVPPRSWFTPSERKRFQAITILSCKKCNNGDNVKDEIAKVLLNLCVSQMQRDTPDQTTLYKKTLDKNARLRKPLENAKTILVQDSISGLYTFEELIDIDPSDITDTKDVLKRIARGLYWHHFKEPLKAGRYEVLFFNGVDLFKAPKMPLKERQKKLKAIQELQNLCERIDLLSGVFTYWIGKASNHTFGSCFTMLYRKAVFVCVFALPD